MFATAVRRKLRSDRPVLAELSGGRDSSSIVCVADNVIARGAAEIPRLDTISYYDDSEPNWNERPYFAKVEEKRRRTGWHINVGGQDREENATPEVTPETQNDGFFRIPGYDGRTSPEFGICLASQGNHVVLSGIGGDEVMGGVPTPAPELQNLIARAQFGALAHQLRSGRSKRGSLVPSLLGSRPWILPPALVVFRNISGQPHGCRPILRNAIGPRLPAIPPGRN